MCQCGAVGGGGLAFVDATTIPPLPIRVLKQRPPDIWVGGRMKAWRLALCGGVPQGCVRLRGSVYGAAGVVWFWR